MDTAAVALKLLPKRIPSRLGWWLFGRWEKEGRGRCMMPGRRRPAAGAARVHFERPALDLRGESNWQGKPSPSWIAAMWPDEIQLADVIVMGTRWPQPRVRARKQHRPRGVSAAPPVRCWWLP